MATTGLTVFALLWIGLLLGVSFLATPVKFLAQSLALDVALDVGRHTFKIFNSIELGLAVILFVCALSVRRGRIVPVLVSIIGALVALQAFYLLPLLDARVEVILDGGVPPASRLHTIYIMTDIAKLALLTVVALYGLLREDEARVI